ncbi:MAG: FAD-dependent oxidoreductase [Anaerolineae bacterium]|nr:FAD-dependent oxidoreductase [Anaerolineae bacterium]
MNNIIVYGATWCPDCTRAKQFLGEQRIHYKWIDIEQQPEYQAYVESVNQGKRIIPTIVFDDGSILVEPSNAELAKKLGLQTQAKMSYYDLIIIGGGPTGLTTALYSAREGLNVLVIEKAALGGQAAITERLDNFPGFPDGISGAEFADRLSRQAERFGVELLKAQEVVGIRAEGESRYVKTADGNEYGARALLIATGSKYRRLNVPGEADFIGAGIHFCATCDGPFYKNKAVAVVGGGNSAGEESLFLARFVDEVTILVRGDALAASKVVIDNLATHPKIHVLTGVEVQSFEGNGKLSAMTIKNRKTGLSEAIHPAGVFVFIGLQPNSGWLPATLQRDEAGFIVTGVNLETSLPGVFAAGGVRQSSTQQTARSPGGGATAALMIPRSFGEV